MSSTYIIIDEWRICTAEELPDFKMTRLGVVKRVWEKYQAFDQSYQYHAVLSEEPKLNVFQVFLAHTVFNPWHRLSGTWEKVAEYRSSDLIDAVKRSLKSDDDSIQQWFEGPDIIRLMEAAQSFDEMLLAVRAICGEHETNQDVLACVERILGKQEEGDV